MNLDNKAQIKTGDSFWYMPGNGAMYAGTSMGEGTLPGTIRALMSFEYTLSKRGEVYNREFEAISFARCWKVM